METNSWENTELQFGKGCLIMETLKVNIFLKILMDLGTELAVLH